MREKTKKCIFTSINLDTFSWNAIFILKKTKNMAFQRNRKQDDIACGYWEKVLDRYFYFNSTEITNYERATDTTRQFAGIDTEFTYSGYSVHADEKFTMYWLNLNTFSIELEIENQANKIQNGWFTNTGSSTNAIIGIFFDTTGKTIEHLDFPITNSGECSSISISCVSTRALREYIKSQGITPDTLPTLKQRAINNAEKYNGKGYTKVGKCKVNCLTYKDEKPINIQIPREDFERISFFNKNIKTGN